MMKLKYTNKNVSLIAICPMAVTLLFVLLVPPVQGGNILGEWLSTSLPLYDEEGSSCKTNKDCISKADRMYDDDY